MAKIDMFDGKVNNISDAQKKQQLIVRYMIINKNGLMADNGYSYPSDAQLRNIFAISFRTARFFISIL